MIFCQNYREGEFYYNKPSERSRLLKGEVDKLPQFYNKKFGVGFGEGSKNIWFHFQFSETDIVTLSKEAYEYFYKIEMNGSCYVYFYKNFDILTAKFMEVLLNEN